MFGEFLIAETLQGRLPHKSSRLGLKVSKKFGHAAQRNLFKRRIREIFRCHPKLLSGNYSLVISPRSKARDAPFCTLQKDFNQLITSLVNSVQAS